MLLIIKTQNFTSTFVGEFFFMIFVVVLASPSSIYFCIFQHCIVIAIDFVSAHSTFLLEKLNESLLLFNLTAAEKKITLWVGYECSCWVQCSVFLSNRHRRKPRLLFDREIFLFSAHRERLPEGFVHRNRHGAFEIVAINRCVCDCVDPLKTLVRLPSPIHQMQHVQ